MTPALTLLGASMQFYTAKILTLDEQITIMLKGQRMGYEVSIEELGVGMVITFIKEKV